MTLSRRSVIARAGVAVGAAALPGSAAAAGRGGSGHHPRGHGRDRTRGPIVIGHRGAPAYRPEHTIASYTLAIEMGADFIEPDLCSTKDHQLIARHEPDIGGTTDVATKFPERRTTKTIDGTTTTSWFVDDLTLAELKTLRAVERLPAVRPQNTAFNGLFEVPTFQEVIDLAKAHDVGIYPETKHPTYFRTEGLPIEEPMLATLRRNGLDRPGAKVFIQSFEVSNLKALRRRTRLPLIQLIDVSGKPYDFVVSGDPRTYTDLLTPQGLAEIATYADGIGPDRSRLVANDVAAKPIGAPTGVIEAAHAVGLLLHPFTFRPENEFLSSTHRQGDPASPQYRIARGDQPAELELYFELGVDGLFADNADTAVAVRERVFGRARRG
jgi:glycerophosphoryl diester phosphodiesterase